VFTPERNIFSIFTGAFGVYVKNAKFLFVITLMAFVPVFIFRMFLPQEYAAAYSNLVENVLDAVYAADLIDLTTLVTAPVLAGATNFMLLFFGIELVFFPLSTAAAVYLAGMHLKEEKPTFDGMFNAVMPRFPKMIVTTAIVAVILYILFFVFSSFLLFLSIYFSVGMIFYQHVVADVGRWGFNAISLSRFIIRGRWFRVFFSALALIITYLLFAMAIEVLGVVIGIQNNIFIHLPFFLLQHFALSFFAVVFALWYYDIKRFHKLNFAEIEKELMEHMRQRMDGYGRRNDMPEDEDERDRKDE